MSITHPVGTYSYRTATRFFQRGAYYQAAPSGPRPRALSDIVHLAPIAPAPVRDFRTLDFTRLIASQTAGIAEVTWDCAVSPDSRYPDANPAARLLADPTISQCGQKTTQLFGDGIEGVTYLLTATAEITDGRLFVRRGSLLCVLPVLPEPEELDPCRVYFDYEKFSTLFPELITGVSAACGPGADGDCTPPLISPEQAEAYFRYAEEILRNDCSSPVQNLAEREDILLLLTAHIAALFGGPMGAGGFGPQITSTISSKSVNGVSLSSGGMFGGVNGSQAWYQLTRYGQLAWMKLRAYRLFYYVPGPQRDLLSPFTSWPWKIGAAPGYMWLWGWGGGPCRPPRPPLPPEPPIGCLYVDRRSVIGDGMSAQTALAVRIVDGNVYDGNGLGREVGVLEFPVPQGRATGFTVWIDSVSLAGDGLTTPLAVRAVVGDPGAEPLPFAPVAVQFPSWPSALLVDGVSVIGAGTTPDQPLSVRVVAGRVRNGG